MIHFSAIGKLKIIRHLENFVNYIFLFSGGLLSATKTTVL